MKSISIHGIDEETENKINERAKSEGKSVNKVVKELISKALGPGEGPSIRRPHFADLCGVWTKAEAAEFLASLADIETVDPGDWR